MKSEISRVSWAGEFCGGWRLRAPHTYLHSHHLDKYPCLERQSDITDRQKWLTHTYIWRDLKRQRHKIQSESMSRSLRRLWMEYLRLSIQIQSHAGAGLCLWWSGVWWNLCEHEDEDQIQIRWRWRCFIIFFGMTKYGKKTLQSQPRRTTHLWFHLHVGVGDRIKETDFTSLLHEHEQKINLCQKTSYHDQYYQGE